MANPGVCGTCGAMVDLDQHDRDVCHAEPDEIRAVVCVACPVCDGLTPLAEANRFLTVTCIYCGRAFDVPRSSVHDAQQQCLAALREA